MANTTEYYVNNGDLLGGGAIVQFWMSCPGNLGS